MQLALDLVERLGVFRVVPRELEQHAHARQRRADLVRHAREQLALVGHLLLDAIGHGVDGVGEHADLAHVVTAPHAHAAFELAFTDGVRDARDLGQRAHEPARDESRAAPQRGAEHQQHQREHAVATMRAAREHVPYDAPVVPHVRAEVGVLAVSP